MTNSIRTGVLALGALALSTGLAMAQAYPQLGSGAGGGVPNNTAYSGGRAGGMSAGGVAGGAGTPQRFDSNRPRAYEGFETGTIMRTSPTTSAPMAASMEWKWAQCAKLYPTFDAASGTFVGEDGLRHLCQ
ncbi:hypothetical protein GCM10007036_04980 [Alsobacter metallidurans]|uniref:Lectin-like protein BA14k n=1 Tax=Alsobacter metallidurans TaxID=340221 RepID=A0A917MFK2_9HYPH|nr:BA14K family protein [Alsobacter metallidurans]GGH09107.1 hypothetical protein GCM10007036_04980 [Alsobacter metallidurans]